MQGVPKSTKGSRFRDGGGGTRIRAPYSFGDGGLEFYESPILRTCHQRAEHIRAHSKKSAESNFDLQLI